MYSNTVDFIGKAIITPKGLRGEGEILTRGSETMSLNIQFKQQELDKIVSSRGMVRASELIVPKNGIVTLATYQKLLSYKEQYESDYFSSQKYYLISIGYGLLCALVLMLYLFYLKNNNPSVFIKLRWIVFLLSWVVLFTYLMYGIRVSDVLNPYMVPFCIAPIVIKNFHSRELAFVTHIIIVLIVG